MKKITGLMFSGQGAQAIGMGKDLAERWAEAREVFEKGDEILGRSLTEIMWQGPEEELTRTSNCQPALFLHGIAILEVLRKQLPDFQFAVAAGLSLGEFTAHAAGGTFSWEEGVKLVEKRGAYMENACEENDGSMIALIGADEFVARDLAAEADVDVANLNCPGQVVLSGERAKIALVAGLAKEKGVRRAIELKVAGAYHSRLMDSAALRLQEALQLVSLQQPAYPVLCNVDAIPVSEEGQIRKSLVDQVTGTVRWTECMEKMASDYHCNQFLELGTGNVLAGLLGKTLQEVEVHSLGTAENLEKFLAEA